MPETKTYLELSQEDGAAHKFYEVVLAGNDVSIRFGRIGDSGQAKTTAYPTPEKALAEATKKINELSLPFLNIWRGHVL
jgi:predicted DNA-binding WGR domain protein